MLESFQYYFQFFKKNEYVHFTDYVSGIRLPDGFKLAINWKNYNDVTIWWHDVIIKFSWVYFVSLVKFSYWFKFYVNIITGSGVQFSFIRDWPEIRKLKIPPSKFCPIPGDQGKLGIVNLAQKSQTKCYYMLQNARLTAFIVSVVSALIVSAG